MTLLAFHNDPAIKAEYIRRAVDNLRRGATGQDGKGCAVWCALGGHNHAMDTEELGIPEWLGKLVDRLLEGMSFEKSRTWPLVFLDAIEVGDDLERVRAPFLIMVLEGTLDHFDHGKFPEVVSAVNDVIALLRRPDVSSEEWNNAAVAAVNAAKAAADDAAKAAAYAAAYAADYDDYAAANAYADAADAEATVKAAKFDEFADKLIEMIKKRP